MRWARAAFAIAALIIACGGNVQVGSSDAAGEDGRGAGGTSGGSSAYADASTPDAARDARPQADGGTQHTDSAVSSADAKSDGDAASPDSTVPSCPGGREACGPPYLEPCPNGYYCSQGCCISGGPA